MKTEVYSWRLSGELKTDLERQARLRGVPVSSILDSAVRDWLEKNNGDSGGDEAQRLLHAAAARCFGAFAGGDSRRAERAGQAVRKRLRRHYAR
jgi:hypothetical protein